MSRSVQRAAALAAIAVLAWLLTAPGGVARAVELEIEAPRFTYDRDADLYVYEDGRLTLGDLTLFASELKLNARRRIVRASGYVRLEAPGLTGIGENLELDVESRIVRFTDASIFNATSGAYLRAEEMVIYPSGRLQLRSCTVTVCPPGEWARWQVAASSLDVVPDQLAVAWNPRLFLGPVPVLWLPVVAGPAVLERRSGMLAPRLEQDSSGLERYDVGWRLELPVFVNLGFDHDLTLTPEGIENRGGALEAVYNYAFWPRQTGRLTVWGIRERDPRDPAVENDLLTPLGRTPPTQELTRYRTDWVHNQALGTGGRLVLSYHHTSDGQLRREYERVDQYRPYRTYQAGLAGQWRWADASLTFEQNADYVEESVYADSEAFTDLRTRPRLLPRLSTRLGGRVSETLPLALELDLGAARFIAEEAVSGELYTASPTVTLPVSLGGAFELRPSLTRHAVTYTGLTQSTPAGGEAPLPQASFAQTEGRIELRTALARVFEPDGGRFAALKHRFTPRLILTGVEDVPQPLADRVLRARVAQRLVTLRLDNALLGRGHAPEAAPDPTAGDGIPRPGWNPAAPPPPPPVSELLQVNLIQRYNLLRRSDAPDLEGPGFDRRQETAFGQPLLPLLLEIQAGGPYYSASALFSYHHQLERTTRTVLNLNGQLSPRVKLGLGYTFNEFTYLTPDNKLEPAANAFRFDGELSWSEAVTTGFAGRLNLQDAAPPLKRRLDRGSAFVDYHPTCYAIRLSYAEAVASTVQGGTETFFVDRQVMLTFSLGGPDGRSLQPTRGSAAAVGSPPPPIAHASAPAQCRG